MAVLMADSAVTVAGRCGTAISVNALTWQAAGRYKNRSHEITGNLVPPEVAARLRRAGEEYGYGA